MKNQNQKKRTKRIRRAKIINNFCFAKSAVVVDVINDRTLEINIDLALNLHWGDTIWIDEDATLESHPFFLNATQEDIREWADGWYAVVQKNFLMYGRIEIEVMEIHEVDGEVEDDEGGFYKSIFRKLDHHRYIKRK